MNKIAIIQSNYIPWRGYFDLIAAVDEFIIYDEMQFTKRDWRNRNQIKTSNGLQWLTVPVKSKGNFNQKISDTEIDGQDWVMKHWKTLKQNYINAPFFIEICAWLEPIYFQQVYSHISILNRVLITAICDYLMIKSKISSSKDYALIDGKTDRLANLCTQAGGNIYISGPSAKEYINEEIFHSQGIGLEWFDYGDYPQYPQQHGRFIPEVSILDLLFNCGPKSAQYMRYVI